MDGTLQNENKLVGTLSSGNSMVGGLGTVIARDGKDGVDGKSAYEIWLAEGNTGTEAEFLASLKGADGTMTFADLTEEQKASLKGDPFTYEDFTPEQLAALKGEKGDKPTIESTETSDGIVLIIDGDEDNQLFLPFGRDGENIESIEQTKASNVSGGENEITITTDAGREFQFIVKNGAKGDIGNSGVYVGSGTPTDGENVQIDPSASEAFTIPDVLQTTGDSEVDTMSQKAITEAIASSGGGTVTEEQIATAVEAYMAENPMEYYLLKSPNGTIYKVTVSDAGTLQIVDKANVDLPDLIPGRLLVWSDEFDGDSVNLDNWYFRKFGFDGLYANPNVSVYDSMLDMCVIKDANGKVTGSTLMVTNGRAEFKYGRIEARMKFDRNFHTALWCIGQTQTVYNGSLQGKKWCYCGEVDIYEPTNTGVYSTLHWGSEDESVHNAKRAGEIAVDYTEWHTYAVEWTETSMVFYCDDTVIGSIDNLNELTNPDGFKPFNAPHYIILQTMHNANTAEGEYHCYVDWVRYYAPEGVTEKIDIQSLELNETTLSLNPNRVKELELTMTPDYVTDNTLIWASSNTDVATFAGGNRVTAISNGTADLTATAKNGVQAVCKLTVSDEALNAVEGIEIVGTGSTSVMVGESANLSAIVSPKWATYLDVNWETSNSTIATVTENGVVSFIGSGDVIITAKAKDDSGVTASVSYVVKANIVDNISTENAVLKFTRNGWNQPHNDSTEWVADIPANTAVTKANYSAGEGYLFPYMGTSIQNGFETGFKFTDNYTIGGRVKLVAGDLVANEQRICDLHTVDATGVNSLPRVYLALNKGGRLVARVQNETSLIYNGYHLESGLTLSDTDPTYVNVILVHESRKAVRVYVNGIEKANATYTGEIADALTKIYFPVHMGSPTNASSLIYQAFFAYNKALTAEEAVALNTALDEMYPT